MPPGISDSCYYLQPPLCLEQIPPQAMTAVRVWQIHGSPCDSMWGSTRDTTVTIPVFISDQGFPVFSCRAMDPFEIVMRAPEPLTKETFRYTRVLVLLERPETSSRLHTRGQGSVTVRNLVWLYHHFLVTWKSTEAGVPWRMKEESEGPNVYALEMAPQVALRKSWRALGIIQMSPERRCWKSQVDVMIPAWCWQRSQATVSYLENALWTLHVETIRGKDSGRFWHTRESRKALGG